MSTSTYAYSPRQIVLTLGSFGIDGGFGQDTFLEIEKEEDDTVDVVGVYGDVAVAAVHDDRASAQITLLPTSVENDKLSELRNAGRRSPAGLAVFSFDVRDLNGRSLHRSPQAWIQGIPTMTYQRGIGERVWTIKLARLETFIGGANVVTGAGA